MYARLLTLFSVAAAVTLRDCGDGKALFTLNSQSIDPPEPTPGSTVVFNLDYTVPEGLTVSDGTTTYSYTYNFIPFSPTTNPLCQDLPCPVGPGRYQNTTKTTWPSGVSGYIVSTMTWTLPDSQLLLCSEMTFNLAKKGIFW